MKTLAYLLTRICRNSLIVALVGPSLGVLQAYPGAPSTWTWRYYEDSRYLPQQIAATTDPDGRLRTLFTNRSGFFYFQENGINHRVHHAIMQSFRPLGTTLIEESVAADLRSITGPGREESISDAASLEPRRHSVYSVAGPAGTLAYGGSYRRLLASDTFGDVHFPSSDYNSQFRPMLGRAVLHNLFASFGPGFFYAFGGAEGNELAALEAPGSTPNRMFLVNRTDGDVRLTYYEKDSQLNSLYFSRILSDVAPAGWATSRVITGGSLAVTPDRRDFYALITSYKIQPGGVINTEARVFRLRTASTTSLDGDGNPIINIASVTTTVPYFQNLPAGTATSKALKYPTILLSAEGSPKWVCWENSLNKIAHFVAKNTVSGGTTEENARSIANGYEDPFSATIGSFFGSAAGPAFALDRRGFLHLAYIEQDAAAGAFVRYSRETSTGGFEGAISLGGSCTSPPALAMGPGDYPYVVYQGYAPASGAFDKLVIAYPSGLADNYRGDYEDRDKDGRSGLLEFAQNTSDTVFNPPTVGGPILSVSPGNQPRLVFQVQNAATWVSQDHYRITQGTDTIDVRIGYSYNDNALRSFFNGGFTRINELNLFGLKTVTVDDNIYIGPNHLKSFYRLEVKRTPGPP